jgi:hypothetical protein
MGRIFAEWAIVNYGHFFKNYRSSPNLWATLFQKYKLLINFDKIWVGLYFGRFFHKLIWSHCLGFEVDSKTRPRNFRNSFGQESGMGLKMVIRSSVVMAFAYFQ